MRRLPTFLLEALAVASFALAMVVITLWIIDRGSHMSREMFVQTPGEVGAFRMLNLSLCSGSAYIGVFSPHVPTTKWDVALVADHSWSLSLYCYVVAWGPPHAPASLLERLGFAGGIYSNRPSHEMFRSALAVMAPMWFVLVLLGILPVVRCVVRFRNYGRKKRGLCSACGYDLRATPSQCPECGKVSAAPLAE